jgi:hypothetical protein
MISKGATDWTKTRCLTEEVQPGRKSDILKDYTAKISCKRRRANVTEVGLVSDSALLRTTHVHRWEIQVEVQPAVCSSSTEAPDR